MTYFKKNWNTSLQKEVLELGQKVVCHMFHLGKAGLKPILSSSKNVMNCSRQPAPPQPLSHNLQNGKRPKVFYAQPILTTQIQMMSTWMSDQVPHGSSSTSDTLIPMMWSLLVWVLWHGGGYVSSSEDILELTHNFWIGKCTLLPDWGIPRLWLLCYHGIISLKWTCLLLCRYYS